VEAAAPKHQDGLTKEIRAREKALKEAEALTDPEERGGALAAVETLHPPIPGIAASNGRTDGEPCLDDLQDLADVRDDRPFDSPDPRRWRRCISSHAIAAASGQPAAVSFA
jgi:hypothetical protein